MKDLRLHSYWRSSCSWRVRIALQLKQLEYEYVPVHLVRDGGKQHTPSFEALNPMRQVPVLEWTEAGERRRLGQSLAIVRYLDQQVAGAPLVPTEPYQAAKAWELAEIVNAGIQPLQNMKMLLRVEGFGGDRKTYGQDVIGEGLAAMERLAGDRDGAHPFLVGDAPSVADICLVPQLYNARRFAVDLAPFPRLLAAEEACAELEAFQAAHPDAQPDHEEAAKP